MAWRVALQRGEDGSGRNLLSASGMLRMPGKINPLGAISAVGAAYL